MSLSYMASHSPQTFRTQSVSSSSDDEGPCGIIMNCWSKKPSPTPTTNSVGTRQQVTPVPMSLTPSSPRLMRCHAVRRDIFRDWNFDDMGEGGRQIYLNLSTRA